MLGLTFHGSLLVGLQVEGGAEEREGTGEGGASPGEGEDTPMDS